MKRIVPSSRSTTRAASAGSSARSETPARSRRASGGVPNAEASARASWVSAGRPEIRTRTSSSSVAGTGRGCSGSVSPSSARATSSAKNGFPPERSWMRSNVWRANGLPSRSRSNRWSAPTLSGPIRSRWTLSAPSGRRIPTGAPRRRAAARGAAARDPLRDAGAQTRAPPPTRHRATGDRRSRRERARRARGAAARSWSRYRARADRPRRPGPRAGGTLERAPPRRRQRRQDVLEDVLEQVAETRVGEAALRLGGP